MADIKPIICGKPRLYVPETGCEDCLKQRDVKAGSNVSVTYNGDGTVTVNAEPGDLSNYYTKSETYNKVEVDNLVAALEGLNIEVVDSLPATGEERTIYLVPNAGGTGKDEYMWVNGAWEIIGSTDVDLTDYYNKTEADALLANKVDKVTGKGLSTNDFTNALKTKLEGIDTTTLATKTELNNKQDKLTAGDGINISAANVISVNLTKADLLDILGYKETTIVMTNVDGTATTQYILVKE